MTKTRDIRPKLSFQHANAICQEFVPIGDQVFDYIRRLKEAGFKAFLPRYAYIESFAETPEELEIHRRCVVEIARERLARPWPMRIYDEELKHVWVSPYLQRLRVERDKANGVPVDQLSGRYPGGESAWRREVDPCQRKLIQARVQQKVGYEAQWTAVLDAERRALEDEAARHATGLGKIPHTFDNKGRYVFFAAVMERDAVPLGFRYDKPKSRPNYPVFSKPMGDDWDLCWVVEEARAFFHSPLEGHFAPFLEIRGRNLRGTLAKAESGEFLHIRHAGIVPGFGNGYWIFFDLDQLETVIKAHLYLYSLIAPIIESGIEKVLGALPP
jgi:hypothetical protein